MKTFTSLVSQLSVDKNNNKKILQSIICPQERLDKTRDALSESKKQNHKQTEQNQNLQRDLEDLQVKDSELEKQNRSLKEVGGSHWTHTPLGGSTGSWRRPSQFFNVTTEPETAAAGGGAPVAAAGPGQLEAAAAGEGGAAAEGGRPAGLPEEGAGREDRGGAEAGTARQREVGAQEGSGEGDDIITQPLFKLNNHYVGQTIPTDRAIENFIFFFDKMFCFT